MISHIFGIITDVFPDHAVVDVNGMGYAVQCPGRTLGGLVVGQKTKLFTVLVVREDAHILYGFDNRVERQMFELLTGAVSGVGPRIALSLLSSFTVGDIAAAIFGNQPAMLARANGVGKKMAEKIIVELKDRLQKLPQLAGAEVGGSVVVQLHAVAQDVASALINLGYQPKQAEAAALAASQEADGFEAVFRLALKKVG